MTAATYVSTPSQSASTSTSTACSTKRSTRTREPGGGAEGDAAVSVPGVGGFADDAPSTPAGISRTSSGE